jgi:hypothetical protein
MRSIRFPTDPAASVVASRRTAPAFAVGTDAAYPAFRPGNARSAGRSGGSGPGSSRACAGRSANSRREEWRADPGVLPGRSRVRRPGRPQRAGGRHMAQEPPGIAGLDRHQTAGRAA